MTPASLLRAGSRAVVLFFGSLAVSLNLPAGLSAQELQLVTKVEFQPVTAATKHLVEALDYVGAPLEQEDREAREGHGI